MKNRFAIAAAMLIATQAPVSAQDAGAVSATQIDPQAYTGLWFEVARTPAPFQEQCDGGVTAHYQLLDESTMQVVNRCDTADGGEQSVSGEADVLDGNFNTFDVQLSEGNDAPGINYVIAAASDIEDGQYQWAAVVSPEDRIGWILSRAPELDDDTRHEAEAALEQAGVDIAQLSDTPQPPQNYQPED